MKAKILSLLVFLAALTLAACAPTPATSTPLAPTPIPPTLQPSITPSPTLAEKPTQTPTLIPLEPTGIPTPPDATIFPDPTAFEWREVARGPERPIGIFDAGDGTGLLYILYQPGYILTLEDGALSEERFLDISERVGNEGNEQGLLGMAFDPDYDLNGFLYVNYTDLEGQTVIARYSARQGHQSADPGSEKILFQAQQPYANHNGGMLAFGPDGYLYIGMGDGGSADDPQNNAQNLNSPLGKLLRIDVTQGEVYAIPSDNPFIEGGGMPEVWAYGLRNPWRFSFDRNTGDLYIGDVGQGQIEEIDYLPARSPGGTNFGWRLREGSNNYLDSIPEGAVLTDPVFEYTHAEGCSVTGGYVYRGQALPEFYGIYLFADFCNGKVWGLLRGADGAWQSTLLFQLQHTISTFGVDSLGEIYLTDFSGGRILKLVKR